MTLADLSGELQSAIHNAATQFGVSANDLGTLASIESGGNINANNGIARGPFQLTSGTANQLGVTNPFDPVQSAAGAASYWNQVTNYLSSNLGTAVQGWQSYIGYQQGPGGALALFNADPNTPAATALMSAGVSPGTAIKSISGNLPSSFNNGNPAGATVGQFLSYWQNQWNTKSGGSTSAGAVGVPGSTAPTSTGLVDSVTSWASGWIVRVFVFLLGLVFVAAGLFLLSRTGKLTIENAQQNAANNIVPQGVNRVQVVREVKKVEPRSPSDDAGRGLKTPHLRVRGKRMANLKQMAGVT